MSNPGLLISEIRTDPPLGDSNYEWVELIATDNINFAQNPYTVFFSNNGTATSKGWVEGQIPTPPPRNSTYAFLINYGTVSPGDVVYVGGSLMEPSGIKLRVKSTATEPGDGGIGGAFTGSAGVLGNGGGVADGVAVFNKHVSQIDSNTVPVDAIFYGTGIGGAAMADTTTGFTLPVNDRYTGGRLKTSSFLAPEILTFYSIKATGTYNRSTGIYTTPRTWTTNTSAWTSSTSDISLTGNTYLWSNGATTKNISNLASGTYTVTVNTSACSASFSYTVPQASQIQIATTSTAASCLTATNGSIASSVSGGVPPYSYQWSNGGASSGISALSPGNYTLTVTDANGCTAVSNVSVGAGNNLPQITLTPSTAICNGASNGVIASSITGGSSPYVYSWTNGSAAAQINGLAAGTYTVTVTDSVGCSANQSATIQQLPPIVLSSVLPPSNSSGFPIAIKGANLGGIAQVQFGSTPSSTFSLSGDSIINANVPTEATGSSITVIDSIGCQSSIGFNYITSNPELGVRLLIEGLYVGGGYMDLPLVNSGLSGNPQHADSVTISIATATAPHTIVYSAKSLLVSSGHASIRLPGWVVGNSYYIVLNLRNAVETWSKLPVSFNSENTYYNFSSDKSFPLVETLPLTSIGISQATAQGRVIADGGSPVTARGFCWSTAPKPTIALLTKTINGADTGMYTGQLSGLLANTKYYLRAYATNAIGTAYGQEISITTENFPTDVDGNVYEIAEIGTQVWMTKNLRVSRYRNGDSIPNNTTWQNTINGAYSTYNNNVVNDSIYGKLYNWYAVADPRGLCPIGWHIPSDEEWTTLENFIGGSSVAGGMMKAVSPLWQSPNTGANNSSGFTGLPGGYRTNDGTFVYIGQYGFWWSSTIYSNNLTWIRFLNYFDASLSRPNGDKTFGFSVRCIKDLPPTLTTSSITGVNSISSISGGNIIDSGGDSVTVRGVCWSTSQNPTVALATKTTNGSGSGSFTTSITGLQPGTTYYVRAYATNGAGTGYGNQITFTTLQVLSGQIADINGNVYDTVVIGSQVWMKQNLKVATYRNGDSIPTGLSVASWAATTIGAYAIYNNSSTNDSIYGKLYNWYAVADSRGLCPAGWHVSSDSEWQSLEGALGMPYNELNSIGYRGGAQNVGGQMKSVSPLWASTNIGATNSSGFTGLPGGLRVGSEGTEFSIGNYGFWWSSTQYLNTSALVRFLSYNYGDVYRDSFIKNYGFSVRCVRDSPPTVTTSSVSGINSTSATCGGNIADAGGDSVTVRGVCWSTSPNPTIALPTKTSNGSGSGSFTSSITGLQPGTTYYVRAYATNDAGTGYGNEISFTTDPGVYDIDGNIYDTVVIGSQVWLKQNLKVSKYRNGDPILTGLSDSLWQTATIGAYSIYNNSLINDSIYGKLYNYYTISDSRGLCPTGWHVPTELDWQTMETYLGVAPFEYNGNLLGVAQNVGGKLKASETLLNGGYWFPPNQGANNQSGFSALPGGNRSQQGDFVGINDIGLWWVQGGSGNFNPVWLRVLFSGWQGVQRNYQFVNDGYSIRCVKD